MQLELPLEMKVSTWSAPKRVAFAEKLERWAHQLRVSAFILEKDSKPAGPPKKIKYLAATHAALN